MTKSRHPDFDLILFDLDGTLVDSSRELADAVNDMLADAGGPPVTQQMVDLWIGHGTRALVAQALAFAREARPQEPRLAADLEAHAAVFDRHYMRRCGTRSALYPHVRQVLQGLQGLGVRLAVVTNKDECFTHRLLQAHDVAGDFALVVGGDTMPSKKPDPAGILHCLQHLGVDRERSLFVGDSAIDVDAARNAAVRVWAVPYGYNQGQAIERCGPDRVIDDFRALLPR